MRDPHLLIAAQAEGNDRMSGSGFADRMAHVGYSGSLAIIAKVREMRREGIEVIDFGRQGDAPEIAREAAIAMMRSAASSVYTDPRGLPALRATIARKLEAENGIAVDPDRQLVVTIGAKQAILATLLALVDRGDEVLLEDPGYVSFEPMVRLAGATPVAVPLGDEDGFRLPIEALRRRVTPRTRLLLLCNPHNPTGRCLTAADLAAVAELAEAHDLRVLIDEAYEHYVYDGRRHLSLAALPGMADRTVTVQTVSKVYNMGGWRVGWVAAAAPVIRRILAVHTHSVTCPASFAQAGAEAAIRAGIGEGDLPIAAIVAKYQRQRDAMVAGLRRIPGVTCVAPEGAYFAFPSIRRLGLSSVEFSRRLLETAHVATTPGSAFGAAGEGHVRVVIKSDVAEIERGVARMAEGLAAIEAGVPG